jgi:hypothetical protein
MQISSALRQITLNLNKQFLGKRAVNFLICRKKNRLSEPISLDVTAVLVMSYFKP